VPAVHAIDPRYPITDGVLFGTLQALARCALIEGAPKGAPSAESVRTTNVTITPLGRQALAGAIDRVHECGIDDWRGGVRLSGHGPVWRWDGRERKLIER